MAFWIKKENIEPDQKPVEWTENHEEYKNSREKKKSLHHWKLIVAALTAFLALLGLIYGAISYTSTPPFCATCHEMAAEHVTFQASAHNQIKCTECHIKPGTANLVIHKVESLKEVYSHIVGPPDTIIQTVAVSDENCKQCHSKNRLISATGDLIVNHDGHIEEGIPCITCHSGVAHAKVVERGINRSNTYDYWTTANAKKLIDEEYVRPNMGTCIDCHDQVNQGKKPWKDIAYSLPENPAEKKDSDSISAFKPTPEMEAGVLERDVPENTQKIILQALGHQKDGVKISMDCFVCHQKINTPKNHGEETWGKRHGYFALNDLNECLKCHQDSKWVKKFKQQDIRELLSEDKELEKSVQYPISIKELSRKNDFCITCHSVSRPDDHLDRYTWLTDTHRMAGDSKEAREGCYVCHNFEKPEPSKGITAPSDVYCQFCHKNGFVGETIASVK
ncbi:cytochrome c3 family protein [Bacillus sp. T3]|uniref:cytochrome c3 family protein n=1 Tax=Bacillus sp. T3 TaxID=467262 RepID=UPI002981FF81|nr:NapC/NirT family cytochrome c [Bacillus sp. T3]